MDHKKNPHRRSKRQNKIAEDNYWDCSVCTYRNTAEAFKCLMCDVRKGTSTRKPRINPQLVAQQVAQQYNQSLPKVKKESAPGGIASSSSTPTTTPTPPVTTSSSSSTILPSNPPPPPPPSVAAAAVVVSVAATTAIVTATTTTVTTTAVTNTTATNTLTAASSKVDSGIAAGNKSEKRYSPSVDSKSSSSTRRLRPKLKNVDRSSAEHKAVTVNNVTVIITEFQPKRHYSSSSDHGGHHPSSGSTAPGSNHSSGGGRGGASVGGGGGAGGGMATFQMEASPAENGLHPELSHKHQRLAL